MYNRETIVSELSTQVGSWLNATLALATTHDIPAIAAKLRVLNERSKVPGFRLTVVGETQRGKSTLINYILGQRILQKSHQTATTITSIVASQDEQIDVHAPHREQEIRLVDHSYQDDLIMQASSYNMPEEVIPHVFITLRHPWLQRIDLEIIDTPSMNMLNKYRTVLLSEMLSQSDAVMLVVNASAALSLTEMAFLEQEVVGRHVPRIMVVVTKLDTIPQEEREAVLENVREKVVRISPLIPVLSSAQIRPDTPDSEKIKAVQAQIEKLAAKSERRNLRSRQVAETLLDYLNQIIEVGHTAIAAVHMDAVKRAEALKLQVEERRQSQLRWLSIEQELDNRRLLLDNALRKRLYATRDNVMAAILLELARTQDVKAWYERELPLQLYREFFSVARTEESYLLERISEDMQWLRERVENVFHVNIKQNLRLRGIQTEIGSQLKDKKVVDTERFRFLLHIGSGAAMVAYYMLFFNPIGAAISGAVSVATEFVNEITLNKKAEVLRQDLSQEVVRSIERAMDEYIRLLSRNLLAIYKEVAQDVQQAQSTLQVEKVTILKENVASLDDMPWQQLIDQASALEQKILTTFMQKGE